MTVDEFLVWAETQPGRYELEDGEIVSMSPERTRHARSKSDAHAELKRAIRAAQVPCEALPDGMTVRVDDTTAFEPDALIYCGPRIGGDTVEVPSPVVIVEVLSPGCRSIDLGSKLYRYWQIPSVQHVLLIDPKQRLLIHHARAGEGSLVTRFLQEGELRIEPPGITVDVAALIGEPD